MLGYEGFARYSEEYCRVLHYFSSQQDLWYLSGKFSVTAVSYTHLDVYKRQPKGFEKNLLDGNKKNLIQSSKRKDSASGYFLDEQVDQ